MSNHVAGPVVYVIKMMFHTVEFLDSVTMFFPLYRLGVAGRGMVGMVVSLGVGTTGRARFQNPPWGLVLISSNSLKLDGVN